MYLASSSFYWYINVIQQIIAFKFIPHIFFFAYIQYSISM